ncbi:hypothetical protein MC885_018908 [Smutsia gigantea]|nr:hypothetical protein MC885_018908 [Smutsia gigantea]
MLNEIHLAFLPYEAQVQPKLILGRVCSTWMLPTAPTTSTVPNGMGRGHGSWRRWPSRLPQFATLQEYPAIRYRKWGPHQMLPPDLDPILHRTFNLIFGTSPVLTLV